MMKRALVFALTALLPILASATIYNDATGDLHNGVPSGDNLSGFAHLDIASVEVTNDASTIFFAITVNTASIIAPDWGKYMIGIDSTAGGDTVSDGWARPISMSSGMDYWIGSWVDGGAPGSHQVFAYSGTWAGNPIVPNTSVSGPTLNIAVPLSELGLSDGDTFTFDVYSSGGGGSDGAVDALGLGTPSITTWGASYNSGTAVNSYTVVPEPSTMALLGLAGGLLAYRRIRAKK